MKRRTFIAGLAGGAVWVCPVLARAQNSTPGKIWRVGYLSVSSATDFSLALFDAFRLKLRELGYVEGRNLRIDVRRADFDYARLPALAAELISFAPDVLAGLSPPATTALQQATSSIPIVMVAIPDPIGSGFVKSFANPGGNITGNSDMSVDLAPKSLDLLHVVVPKAKRIAVLTMSYSLQRAKVEAVRVAAEELGLTTFIVPTPTDLDNAFTTIHNENCDALVVIADSRINRKIVELANASRLPAIYQIIDYVDMGGLLGYGPNGFWMFPQAAIYVDKILRGARPADLPVEQPTQLELRINLNTAKALGLTIPTAFSSAPTRSSNETTRVHCGSWRSGGVAGGGARGANDDAGTRLPFPGIAGSRHWPDERRPSGSSGSRLCCGRKCSDRISRGAKPI
jgi:putative ABC transport system substrate-binding protein